MTGIVVAVLAFGLIAGLMLVGIRMKLPPPDPNWREHLPPPVPAPTRSQVIFLLGGRVVLWLGALAAAALHAIRLFVVLMVAYGVLMVTVFVIRIRAVRRARRTAAHGPKSDLP